jgi:hypothetical protein
VQACDWQTRPTLRLGVGASRDERRKPVVLQEAAVSDRGCLPGLSLSLAAFDGVERHEAKCFEELVSTIVNPDMAECDTGDMVLRVCKT